MKTIPFEFYFRPKIRFDITAKLESERRAEQKQTLYRIDEDRGHLIEAAIVRIMKMRKTLTNRVLIGEVLNQLSSKFIPKVPHIKVSNAVLISTTKYLCKYSFFIHFILNLNFSRKPLKNSSIKNTWNVMHRKSTPSIIWPNKIYIRKKPNLKCSKRGC